MHWSHRPLPQHRTWSVTLLGALLCLAGTTSAAAPAVNALEKTFAQMPHTQTGAGLGQGVGGELCTESHADLMEAATASGSALHAAPEAQAGGGASAAPAAPAAPQPAWEVRPADKTLNTTLARWAAAAGWQLVWELPVDYAVSVRTEIRGSFTEAVEMVAKSMDSAEIPMKAIFYDGNRVLRIVAKGTE